jgi:thioredoxin-related protein
MKNKNNFCSRKQNKKQNKHINSIKTKHQFMVESLRHKINQIVNGKIDMDDDNVDVITMSSSELFKHLGITGTERYMLKNNILGTI